MFLLSMGTRVVSLGATFGCWQRFCPRFDGMKDREPTVRGREVGDFLRRAMKDAGFTGEEMARKLDWSGSRVSRLLSGKRGGSDMDVSAFLAVCGVRSKERERMVKLCREGQLSGYLQQYGTGLPKQVRILIDHENHATEIKVFAAILVPGLVQTAEYARQVIGGCVNVPPGEVNDRVSARLGRANLFTRDRPP